jgi:hypothetical protein
MLRGARYSSHVTSFTAKVSRHKSHVTRHTPTGAQVSHMRAKRHSSIHKEAQTRLSLIISIQTLSSPFLLPPYIPLRRRHRRRRRRRQKPFITFRHQ